MIPRISHLRWWIVALIFGASVLNYVDRQTPSVLAPTIPEDLTLSNEDYASALSLFLVAYTTASLLSGRIVYKLGVRVSLALFHFMLLLQPLAWLLLLQLRPRATLPS